MLVGNASRLRICLRLQVQPTRKYNVEPWKATMHQIVWSTLENDTYWFHAGVQWLTDDTKILESSGVKVRTFEPKCYICAVYPFPFVFSAGTLQVSQSLHFLLLLN